MFYSFLRKFLQCTFRLFGLFTNSLMKIEELERIVFTYALSMVHTTHVCKYLSVNSGANDAVMIAFNLKIPPFKPQPHHPKQNDVY